MKRHIVPSIIGICGGFFLIFLYAHSTSKMHSEHDDIVKLFVTARQVEADLEKDLLKSRSFLLQSYDPIASNEQIIDQLCTKFKDEKYHLYKGEEEDLDTAIVVYCHSLEAKLKMVETFKSKSSIMRNSLFFIHQIAHEENSNKHRTVLETALINSAISYALISTEESSNFLKHNIELSHQLMRKSPDENLSSALRHSEKIFEIKSELDSLTLHVVNSESSLNLESVRKLYIRSYNKAEASAQSYQIITFSLCVALFIFIIYVMLKLVKAAQALKDANHNLEDKVAERTKDLVKSQETIMQQQQALVTTSKMSALGEMAGGVAHEINNPLAILQIRISQLEEAVEEGTLEPEFLLKVIDVSSKMIHRMSKIVSGLRSFARDSSRDAATQTKVIDIIEETFSLCREKFSNHGVLLELKMGEELKESLRVECRPTELSQVLINLLNNAFDAIETSKEKWIHVEVMDFDNTFEISVVDCGHGIPEDVQRKMMQPFFTTKEVGRGTGLGLSISQGIIAGHHGHLSIDTTCKNTKFTIMLPKVQIPLLKEVA